MKIFWWSEAGMNIVPTLYCTTGETDYSPIYNNHDEAIREMIKEGYKEVSARTALTLGLPS